MGINLKAKAIVIAGIQGTGKTYLVKYLSRFFNAMVYSPYAEEWAIEDVIYVHTSDFIKEFPIWCSKAVSLAKKDKINLFIIDDADLIFRTHFDVCQSFRELHIKRRHLGSGLALAYCTRRPQDIPTKIYGSCEFWALFSNNSPQVIDLLNKLHTGLGDKVSTIDYQSFQFLLKEIGKEPILMKV